MNNIIKMGVIPASELITKGRDFLGIMSRAFDAEYFDNRRKAESIAEIDSILPNLSAMKSQIAESLVPASEKQIAAYLMLLLKAFPNVGKADGEAFGRLLMEDVTAQNPSVGALEAGCAHVRRTSKFLPSIAEVLEAVKGAQSSLSSVLDRLDDVEGAKSRLEAGLRDRPKLVRLTGGEV